ncbi:NAD(P)H-binding protein [Nonomuraea typhae]|uniref:NAD(P)H-binding protein n=1 Tax=Nonomuraea typhae TaxID=2603600 RepID=UPI0012F94A54|nr:NAD(P)H-binding protein [Nonomuraea typhae]
MRTIIAGGHGQIALRLARLLGKDAVGLVRNPAHVADVEAAGGTALVCDLEHASPDEVAAVLDGASAAVFAAGAGPGSGAARKDTVDRGAAVLLASACERAGVRRHVQISSIGAGSPPDMSRGEVWAAYITAKTAAEEDLRGRDLDWTILRPGRLTDDAGTGAVLLGPQVPRGPVPRDDVAAVVAELLHRGAAMGQTLELVSGTIPLREAVTRYTP